MFALSGANERKTHLRWKQLRFRVPVWLSSLRVSVQERLFGAELWLFLRSLSRSGARQADLRWKQL